MTVLDVEAEPIGDVKAPRPGPADPATCPMCRDLRDRLADAMKRNHGMEASHLARVVQVHARVAHAASRAGA